MSRRKRRGVHSVSRRNSPPSRDPFTWQPGWRGALTRGDCPGTNPLPNPCFMGKGSYSVPDCSIAWRLSLSRLNSRSRPQAEAPDRDADDGDLEFERWLVKTFRPIAVLWLLYKLRREPRIQAELIRAGHIVGLSAAAIRNSLQGAVDSGLISLTRESAGGPICVYSLTAPGIHVLTTPAAHWALLRESSRADPLAAHELDDAHGDRGARGGRS